MAGDHVGARLDALDDEGGHHQGHDCVFGNADGHERDEAGPRRRLVGSRLSGHPLDAPSADLVPVFAEFLVSCIGCELGNRGAATGQDAQNRANHTAAQGAGNDALELGPGRHELDFPVEGGKHVFVVEVFHHLGNAEASQGDTDQANSILQKDQVHGVARHAAVHVGTDHSKQDADHGHGQAIEQAATADKTHAEKTQQHEGTVVGRPEQEPDLPKCWRHRRQHNNGHGAANKARNARGEQRQSCFTFECHLVAIDAGDDAAGVRNLHGDGAHAIAVLRPVVNSGQHDERATSGKGIGQGQQQADGGQRAQSRQQPDQRADRAADGAVKNVLPGQCLFKTKCEVVKDIHISTRAG